MLRRSFLLLTSSALAQTPLYVCPMDPDVRSSQPGKCPRCGMKLVAGAPEPAEYPVEFRAIPQNIPADKTVTLEFRVINPRTLRPVTHFEIIHERLFHLFLVNQDLSYFAHVHPLVRSSGWLAVKVKLPAGTYRFLADFDPAQGTPQLASQVFSTAGYIAPLGPATLAPDLSPKRGENLELELRTDPAQPLAGRKTLLSVHASPAERIERYLGAWAHLLAASDDLIDMIHDHPLASDSGADLQFELFFPRERVYRVWIQIQRAGIVNTIAFTIPVQKL